MSQFKKRSVSKFRLISSIPISQDGHTTRTFEVFFNSEYLHSIIFPMGKIHFFKWISPNEGRADLGRKFFDRGGDSTAGIFVFGKADESEHGDNSTDHEQDGASVCGFVMFVFFRTKCVEGQFRHLILLGFLYVPGLIIVIPLSKKE